MSEKSSGNFVVGQRVAFQQPYGSPVLRLVDDEYRYVYKKRRQTGVVQKLIGDMVLIKVDGTGQYDGLIGKPVSKVEPAR